MVRASLKFSLLSLLALSLITVFVVDVDSTWAGRRHGGGGGGGGDNDPPPGPDYENPYDLPVIGALQRANSDTRAEYFYDNVMPTFQLFIDENLNEMSHFEYASERVLDPTMLYLFLNTDKPIRVYFVHEGAMYQNQLGVAISDAGHGRDGQTPLVDPLTDGALVFPNASYEDDDWGHIENGLHQGDFVELGNVSAGKQLDFFLISQGATGGTSVLRNFEELNSDGLQHVVAYYDRDNFPGFVLIGFEDIVGGGDLDYNDCLFVVDIGYDIAIQESDLPH